MKITLDLSRLLAESKITPDEAVRLKELSSQDTSTLGINILLGFGVVAVSAGAIALLPTPFTGLVVGIVLFCIGVTLTLNRTEAWGVLAQICTVIGTLMTVASILALGEGSLASLLIVTAVLAGAALLARNGLLIAGAVISLAACLGARSGYGFATYSLAIYEPLLTVVLFSALALATYRVSTRLDATYERLALMASRTAVLIVNFGFWIGSLWGDRLTLLRGLASVGDTSSAAIARDTVIPAVAFGIAWALALFAVGVWGASVNRRWVVNVAAVFGAIHFYTQWFERLGATPISILGGGILMLCFAMALWAFNRRRMAS